MITRFFPSFAWWATLVLGIFLFILPVLIGHGWKTINKPPQPEDTPPMMDTLRMPTKEDIVQEPRNAARTSLMVVPSEATIELELREQEERKSSVATSITAPAEGSAAARQPSRAESRGFAFSSSDETNQIMWERQTSSRNMLRQRSSISSASVSATL